MAILTDLYKTAETTFYTFEPLVDSGPEFGLHIAVEALLFTSQPKFNRDQDFLNCSL